MSSSSKARVSAKCHCSRGLTLTWTAGGDDQGDDSLAQRVPVPLMATTLHKTRFDWNVTTTPQKGLANKKLHYVRGKGLGGSTTVSKLISLRILTSSNIWPCVRPSYLYEGLNRRL